MPPFFARTFRTVFLLGVLCGVLVGPGTGVSLAQTGERDPEQASWWNGRYRLGPTASYVPDTEAAEIGLRLSRLVPISIRGPEGARQSRVELLPTLIAVRSTPGGDVQLRGRLALAEVQLYRAPIAVGLTVAEYDRAGLLEEESRWVDLRVGGSFRWRAGPAAIEPRLVGSAGISTLEPGAGFQGLGALADQRATGFDGGAYLELPVRWVGRGYLAARSGARWAAGPGLTIPWMGAELAIVLFGRWHWTADLHWRSLRAGDDVRAAGLLLGTGLRWTSP